MMGPRNNRPKLSKDEDAEQLLRLCREGRLFELQKWVANGRPLTVPAHYRDTPLRVALGTGFHSLIDCLLQHEGRQSAKDEALMRSCWNGQYAIVELAIHHGANVSAVSFQDVVETWSRSLAQLFLKHGADPVTNAPFARAFKQRIKAGLGIFLDCKRIRPDLADALQIQADMALRQACQDDDLKWVSLLMWLGANPRTKGVTTDDLDNSDAFADQSYQQSAMQIACGSRRPEILRRLRPDPKVDDIRELMAAATAFTTVPETVSYLVSLGADINDKPDGGSTALDSCLRYFGWRESVLEAPYPSYQHVIVPASRLGGSFEGLRELLKRGARWTPDARSVADTRRALYRADGQAIATVIDLLKAPGVCDAAVLTTLIRTDKMRRILTEHREASQRAKRQARPGVEDDSH